MEHGTTFQEVARIRTSYMKSESSTALYIAVGILPLVLTVPRAGSATAAVGMPHAAGEACPTAEAPGLRLGVCPLILTILIGDDIMIPIKNC